MLFEGFAKKEGGTVKSWKKRHFRMMDDGVISYYKDQLDAKKLGSIDCNTCSDIDTNVKGLDTGFVIKTGKERNYKIICFTMEERDDFIAAIMSKLPGASETPTATTESTSEKSEVPDDVEESKPEESKPEESKPEEAKTEEAKTEEAKTEEAKTEEAKTEEAKTEEAKAEEKAEETKAVEPKPEATQSETLPEAAGSVTVTSKSGWLFKSGGGKMSSAYQKRWIVVVGSNLQYAKSDKPGSKVSGTIDLSQALFISLNIEDGGFNVGTLGRTYNFKAESAEVAIEWVEHLNELVPEGAQFNHLETSRKQLACSDTAAAEDVNADDTDVTEDRDAMIRALQSRVLELEGQVARLTMEKEAKEVDPEATMTLGTALKAEETMTLGSAQKAEEIDKPSEATHDE